MKYAILDSKWQSTGAFTTIGVVAIKVYGGWKCYIGIGLGDNEHDDAMRIAMNGSKLPKEVACAWFPQLNPEDWRS